MGVGLVGRVVLGGDPRPPLPVLSPVPSKVNVASPPHLPLACCFFNSSSKVGFGSVVLLLRFLLSSIIF